MFEKIFKERAAAVRHRAGPFSPEREKFLLHLKEQGYRPSTLHPIACRLLRLARVIPISSAPLGIEEVRILATRSIHLQPPVTYCTNTRCFRKKFYCLARQWLRFMGRWREPSPPTGPLWDLRDDFMKWMDEERGFSSETLHDYRFATIHFIRWWEARNRSLSSLTARDVDEFVLFLGKKKLSRVSVQVYLTATRLFLRHAERRGILPFLPVDALRGPRIYSQEGLPKGPSRADVERFLMELDTNRPKDIRARAIAILLALYGFRVGEVCRLRLEDVNWENDTITVNRTKQGRRQTYPLLPIAGRALLRYIQDVRPKTSYREIFLNLSAPFIPISRTSAYHAVEVGFIRANVVSPRRGPHALRHSCATYLLSKGLSLHSIAGHLGHRGMSSVRIYAKVDMPALRDVASFDLGNVL